MPFRFYAPNRVIAVETEWYSLITEQFFFCRSKSRKVVNKKVERFLTFRLFDFSHFSVFFALFGVFRVFDYSCLSTLFAILYTCRAFLLFHFLDFCAFSYRKCLRVFRLFAFFWAFGMFGTCRLCRCFQVFTRKLCTLGCSSRRKRSRKPRARLGVGRPRGWDG